MDLAHGSRMDLGGRSHLPFILPGHLCISLPSSARRAAHFFGVAFFGVARAGDLLARAGDFAGDLPPAGELPPLPPLARAASAASSAVRSAMPASGFTLA